LVRALRGAIDRDRVLIAIFPILKNTFAGYRRRQEYLETAVSMNAREARSSPKVIMPAILPFNHGGSEAFGRARRRGVMSGILHRKRLGA